MADEEAESSLLSRSEEGANLRLPVIATFMWSESARTVAKGSLMMALAMNGSSAFGQAIVENSNLWPVYRDAQLGFRISYPATWVLVPKKGPNVRFSVSPAKGAGNCNVVAKPNPGLAGMNQSSINREIEGLGVDRASWADYIGLPLARVEVIESRRAQVHDIPALIGVVETKLENLEGKFVRRQVLAVTITPGFVWSLNCGASMYTTQDAALKFAELRPVFNKILGSFALQK